MPRGRLHLPTTSTRARRKMSQASFRWPARTAPNRSAPILPSARAAAARTQRSSSSNRGMSASAASVTPDFPSASAASIRTSGSSSVMASRRGRDAWLPRIVSSAITTAFRTAGSSSFRAKASASIALAVPNRPRRRTMFLRMPASCDVNSFRRPSRIDSSPIAARARIAHSCTFSYSSSRSRKRAGTALVLLSRPRTPQLHRERVRSHHRARIGALPRLRSFRTRPAPWPRHGGPGHYRPRDDREAATLPPIPE